MFEWFKAGGPLMWIILLCSLVALTIIFERMLTLRKKKILPANLDDQVLDLVISGQVSMEMVEMIRKHSPLGAVYAAGLSNLEHGKEDMKEALEEAGRQVVHHLGRYLNALGTIAAITPLVGLLGTVIGMIKVFTAITAVGVGDPTVLSGGISEALITTAAGLTVGIPSMMFYRYFRSRVNQLAVDLEIQALGLLDTVKNMVPAKASVTTTNHRAATAAKPR